MKKFLLSCFIALGISTSAQYNYTGDFENPGYNTTTYIQFGGGTQAAAAACNGAFGGQLAVSAAFARTGFGVDLSTLTGQTNNGQKLDFSVKYKKGAGIVGTLQLAYYVYNSAADNYSVNLIGAPVNLATDEITTCSTLTGSIPAATLPPGGSYAIGAWFVRSSGSGNIFLDDIAIAQEVVTAAPGCTTITKPSNGSLINGGNLNMTWNAAPLAVNYKVKIGTTSGASDVYNGTVNGTSLNITVAKSTTYFATVTPSNTNGDARGCTEISFSTNAAIAYCGNITSSSPADTYPLSSVSLNGVTKTSSAATGSPAYEDYTSTVFDLKKGVTYNLNAIGTGLGANVFAMTVFIDWNEDGDFNDANEKYFQTPPFISGTGNTVNLNGTIAVPAGVAVGTKRMRVKYNFQGTSTTALQTTLSDPCSNMTNGQTEDYSVSVTEITVAPTCTTFTAPVAMSTNFPSNGKVSWALVDNATAFKLYIGTTPGGTDVVNGTIVNGNSYQVSLNVGAVYYAKVVPTNVIGDATGCTEISFTTAGPTYCAASGDASFEKIGNVTFATINNTSTSALGYENFTSLTPAVLNRKSAYPITVTITGFDEDLTNVWIDYNQDGVFDEITEKTTLSSTALATGSITIPETAKLGNTRMRVRMYYGPIGPNATSCGTSAYGQVEDYTVNIDTPAAVTDASKGTTSVFPNPFRDVLNVSDVKGVKSISIMDISGRLVKTMKPSATLQLSELKTGLYIVNLTMEDGSVRSVKTIKK